jgi:hypothetical protein
MSRNKGESKRNSGEVSPDESKSRTPGAVHYVERIIPPPSAKEAEDIFAIMEAGQRAILEVTGLARLPRQRRERKTP